MLERITTQWTVTRAMYFLMGVAIIIQSAIIGEWPGILMGSYFAAMGLFRFGCASGACFTPMNQPADSDSTQNRIPDAEYKEVK